MINNRNKAELVKFGKNLRKLRKEKNFTQEQLESEAEISKNQVGNIERGEVNVTLISILAISKALNLTPDKLFCYED